MKHAKIIVGKKPASNDNIPEDEMTLAQLIQNAAARGLHSVRGGLYGRPVTVDDNDSDFECNGIGYCRPDFALGQNIAEDEAVDPAFKRLARPPKGTTCACALGAQLLSPPVDNPLTIRATYGNDKNDGDSLPTMYTEYADVRSMQIGCAYEQALRPAVNARK